jgi:hypothetical protein
MDVAALIRSLCYQTTNFIYQLISGIKQQPRGNYNYSSNHNNSKNDTVSLTRAAAKKPILMEIPKARAASIFILKRELIKVCQ